MQKQTPHGVGGNNKDYKKSEGLPKNNKMLLTITNGPWFDQTKT